MCFYHGDVGGPEFFREADRKARTLKKCSECRREIVPGERYRHITGKWDGEFESFNHCSRCIRLIEAIVAVENDEGCRGAEAAPAYGGLFEQVEWSHYAEEFGKRGWEDVRVLAEGYAL